MERRKIARAALLIFGTAIALAVLFSQLFFFQTPGNQAKVIAEQTDSESGNQYLSVPPISLPVGSATVEANQGFIFILEILFESPDNPSDIRPSGWKVSRLLETLLQTVISPNAP